MSEAVKQYRNFVIRDWQPADRQVAADLVDRVLAEYGLGWEPEGTDRDMLQVEAAYWATGGEFWVVEQQGQIVGTGGYYPIGRGVGSIEIRKMYLSPAVRGKGLGRHLLSLLEGAAASRGYKQIWIETASVLKEAVKLYESSGYQPTTGGETQRCDRAYVKSIGALGK